MKHSYFCFILHLLQNIPEDIHKVFLNLSTMIQILARLCFIYPYQSVSIYYNWPSADDDGLKDMVKIVIRSINLSHCCHIFLWLCAWGCCSIICCRFSIYILGQLGFVSFITVQSWCRQIIENIIAWWSYSFVCTLHYLIIIIMQTYLKVLNFYNACHVHSVWVCV